MIDTLLTVPLQWTEKELMMLYLTKFYFNHMYMHSQLYNRNDTLGQSDIASIVHCGSGVTMSLSLPLRVRVCESEDVVYTPVYYEQPIL